jgi:hypothetical protein
METLQGLWPVLVIREGETERFCTEPIGRKYVTGCKTQKAVFRISPAMKARKPLSFYFFEEAIESMFFEILLLN